MATTAVGDRYVLDELRKRGWALGGEQSGHIIDLGFGPSGDGIASALLTLEALAGRDLRDRDAMEKLPQRLVNIRAPDRAALSRTMEAPAMVRGDRARGRRSSRGRGRVLVRASGTEPLIRVMVEAPTRPRPMRSAIVLHASCRSFWAPTRAASSRRVAGPQLRRERRRGARRTRRRPSRRASQARYATTSAAGSRGGGLRSCRGQPRCSSATNLSLVGMPSASSPAGVRSTSGVRQ